MKSIKPEQSNKVDNALRGFILSHKYKTSEKGDIIRRITRLKHIVELGIPSEYDIEVIKILCSLSLIYNEYTKEIIEIYAKRK